MDGLAIEWMHERARETNSLIAGSLIIREELDYYNRFIAMAPDGIVATYDKRHLFRMGNEDAHYKAGKTRIVFEWKGWRILPQICYDLRFPVWIRNQDDYDLILFVANWPEARRLVWRTLLTARALENQAFVAGVNRTGTDKKNTNHAGDSLVINPKGEIINDLGNDSAYSCTMLPIDELHKLREKFPVSQDKDSFNIDL